MKRISKTIHEKHLSPNCICIVSLFTFKRLPLKSKAIDVNKLGGNIMAVAPGRLEAILIPLPADGFVERFEEVVLERNAEAR